MSFKSIATSAGDDPSAISPPVHPNSRSDIFYTQVGVFVFTHFAQHKAIFPVTILALLFCTLPLSGTSHDSPPAAPGPVERVPVEPLGYRAPGPFYMLSKRAFSTLNFVDANHLLFTFHQRRLLQREGDAGRTDQDQLIQALVLSLPGGAVVASSEWRMHDRSRYLWPLGGGKFLVRQRNSYALTDASLKLRPYVDVTTPIQATQVSADGRILVIQNEFERHNAVQHNKLTAQAEKFGDAPPTEDTQITLMDTSSRAVLGQLRTEFPTDVPVTFNGYVGVTRDKTHEDQFLIRFVPFQGQPVLLGTVASTCTPHETFLNQKNLIIESCGPKSADTLLDAWSTDGKKLWTGHRDGHFVWPTFAHTPTGDRFAVSLLRVAHTIDLADSLIDEDVKEQVVQVFDSATGALLLSAEASPILTAGQNFALSDDGKRLAVLHQGAIEIYKVPETAAAEKK